MSISSRRELVINDFDPVLEGWRDTRGNISECPTPGIVFWPIIATMCFIERANIEPEDRYVETVYCRDDYVEIYENIGLFESIELDDYRQVNWQWNVWPDPRCIVGTDHDIQVSMVPAAFESLMLEMETTVDRVRANYGYPVAPQELPPLWKKHQQLSGGKLVRYGTIGERFVYNKINLTAYQNTISPEHDTLNQRFRDFNDGPVPNPPSENVVNRTLITETEGSLLGDLTPEQIVSYLDELTEDQMIMNVASNFVLLHTEPETPVIKGPFYMQSGDTRWVGNITQVNNFSELYGSNFSGMSFYFDLEWQEGNWNHRDNVEIGF